MGREYSNTFNQETDGELIECVEKSGFCDNVLFPHSASAARSFSSKNSRHQLQPCPFPRCLSREPQGPWRGACCEWGGGCCLSGPSLPSGSPVPRPPPRLPHCPSSPLQPEPAEAGKPTSRRPSAESSARKPSEMLSGPDSRELAERKWSSSVHLTPRPWPSSRPLGP